MCNPPERCVSFVFKHIHAALHPLWKMKSIHELSSARMSISVIQSTLMTFGGICDKMYIHMHLCIYILPTNPWTHTGTHATYIVNLLNRCVLFMYETHTHSKANTAAVNGLMQY